MTDRIPVLDRGDRGEVHVLADDETLARAAADLFAEHTMAAVAQRGWAVVALSGGSTPRRMGELLAQPPFQEQVPWQHLHFFWGDERWVPLDSPDSNAGTAKRTFLDQVPVPPEQIHAFPTVGLSPRQAAAAYAREIQDLIGEDDGSLPRFDLVLLGMGDDGHTASLFPGTAALDERTLLAAANPVPKLDATRLTLTAPVINAGRAVVFLVGGEGKADTLAAVLDGPERPNELPAQLIRPVDGPLRWLVDRAAASRLAGFESIDG
ncbi:MAG: 6-phosphogluconolactonase [Chloroflexota bacterium]|nr:6-phosphogluconolactonase [Chloroflexota bacterium]